MGSALETAGGLSDLWEVFHAGCPGRLREAGYESVAVVVGDAERPRNTAVLRCDDCDLTVTIEVTGRPRPRR